MLHELRGTMTVSKPECGQAIKSRGNWNRTSAGAQRWSWVRPWPPPQYSSSSAWRWAGPASCSRCNNQTLVGIFLARGMSGWDRVLGRVGDPDPHVFESPGSFPVLIKMMSRLNKCWQIFFFFLIQYLRLKIMCLRVSYKKKNVKKSNLFCILKENVSKELSVINLLWNAKKNKNYEYRQVFLNLKFVILLPDRCFLSKFLS